jgi:menaquinol-cytochrome c reductase iron-sulfur subunit
MDRRQWLKWLVGGFGLTVTAAIGIPAIAVAISPALRRNRGELWRPIGSLDQFQVGEVVQTTVEITDQDWPAALRVKGIFVWRRSETELVVFSRNCTDLSCPLTFDPGSRWYFCPCHGGMFDGEGEPVSGPPNRPMYRYANRVRNGVVEIDVRSVPPMA